MKVSIWTVALVLLTVSEASIQGISQPAGGDALLGIRYARASRFMPANPEPFPTNLGGRTEHGASCWQPGCGGGTYDCDEDCLFLDVYRPAGTHRGSNRPTLVHIHGGGMTSGAGSRINGSALAANSDIIVVTINYRLGPLGFYSSSELSGEGHGVGGMNGIRDQLVALSWLQDHLVALGGDPARVTISGCSAGGLSVCTHVVAPGSAGKFQAAIMEAGSCIGPWGPGSAAQGHEVSTKMHEALLNTTSEQTDVLAALRGLEASAFKWPQEYDNDLEFSGYWIDPAVVPAHPQTLFAAGKMNVHKLLAGGTSRDGVAGWYGGLPESAENYVAAQRAHWTTQKINTLNSAVEAEVDVAGLGELVAAEYPVASFGGHYGAAYVAADGDYNVLCPTKMLLEYATNHGAKVWQYFFSHGGESMCNPYPVDGPLVANGWAWHCAENAFVWGGDELYYDGECKFTTAAQRLLAYQVMSYWGNFVTCADPNSCQAHNSTNDSRPALPVWPPGAAVAMQLDTPATVLAPYRSDHCEFWKPYISVWGDKSAHAAADSNTNAAEVMADEVQTSAGLAAPLQVVSALLLTGLGAALTVFLWRVAADSRPQTESI